MSIGAVIVTFMPGAEVAENISVLKEQVDGIFVVDDGSGPSGRDVFARFAGDQKVTLIYNDQNAGLAAALNIGVKHAKRAGYAWIATFDQDSRVTDGMIRTMMQNHDAHPDRDNIAVLAPSYREQATGELSTYSLKRNHDRGNSSVLQLTVITSGNLVKAKVFDIVGYYNEDLFIDYVDYEFCFRCADAGYKILGCRNAVLHHQSGRLTRHKILGREVTTTNHDAMRWSCIARNSMYVYKKYMLKHPWWIVRDAISFLKKTLKLALSESDRKPKLANVARGLVHGVVGKLGKL